MPMANHDFRDPKVQIDLFNKTFAASEERQMGVRKTWRKLNKFFMPRSARFMLDGDNQSRNGEHDFDQDYNLLYDSTPLYVARTLGAGMMGGAASPSKPWFRFTVADPDLAKFQPVKEWLATSTAICLEIFQRSNTYRVLHTMFEELGVYGTSATLYLEDDDKIVHHYHLNIGEYYLTIDHKNRVNGLQREYSETAINLVKQFGYKNCSSTVQNAYDRSNYHTRYKVRHIIEERVDRDITKRDKKNMKFRSVYYEVGCNDRYLRESGYRSFRVLAPRWTARSGDIYGQCPGMEGLGDAQQLQHEQLTKGEAIDYQVRPPIQVPTSLKNRDVDRLPGGVTYYDSSSQNQGIRSMWEVRLDMNGLLMDIQDVRQRLRTTFYTDMFLMLAGNQDTTRTATEVAEMHEEKLLMIGPTTERVHNELLDPKVDLTFQTALEQGLLPPPPPELQGVELKVEYVSLLAQAQKAIGANTVDRFVNTLGVVAQMKPGVLDKFNEDYWAESYSDMLGVDPELIYGQKEVALVREQRAEAQRNQQAAESAGAAADTMQKLGSIDTEGTNMAAEMLTNFAG